MTTLGRLVDELTIVELKVWHTTDTEKRDLLDRQAARLQAEIDSWLADVAAGAVRPEDICAPQCKLRRARPALPDGDSVGRLVSALAEANCAIWHNEDVRDELIGRHAAGAPLLEADEKETYLNRKRADMADMIDERLKAIVLEKPCG